MGYYFDDSQSINAYEGTDPQAIISSLAYRYMGQNLDDGEFLNVSKYSLDELYQMVMDNKIYDAKTAIAILKAKAILG